MAKQTETDFKTHDHFKNLDPQLWVDEHADHLFAYGVTHLNDEDLARDLVQETFLAALENIDSFKGNSSVRTWLIAILKYKVIDIYRKRSRIESINNTLNTVEGKIGYFDPELNNWKRERWTEPFGNEPDSPFHHKELNVVPPKCMKKLPALWIAAFTMKHIDDVLTENHLQGA